MKEDTYISPKDNHSSKFAQWFYEEERRGVENESLNKPNALFSLIVGENSGSVTSDTLSPKRILTPSSKLTLAPNYVGVSGTVYNKKKPEYYNSAVVTCEDLEQSIISELGVSSSSSQPRGMLSSQQHGLENEVPLADISNKASQHLLSLLQKGITHKDDLVKGLSLDIDCKRRIQGNSISRGGVNDAEKVRRRRRRSGKDLTLETLFGAAFMNELQSSDAPISVQPVADSPPYGPAAYTSVTEANNLRLGRAQLVELLCSDLRDHAENNLNSISNFRKDESAPGGRQDSSSFSHDPLNVLKPEMDHQSMHAHSSPPPPQFLHPSLRMVNHGRPVFPPHIDLHLMALEGTNHREDAAAAGHPKSGHPPNSGGGSQFDHSIHHPILQQMRISNLHSPPPPAAAAAASLLPGIAYSGGGGGYHPSRVHDQNLAHGFPYAQHHPNPGVLQRGGQYRNNLDSSNLAQTFQSLVDMELRSNPMPNLPSFPGVDSRSRPGFGHVELDPSFWYR